MREPRFGALGDIGAEGPGAAAARGRARSRPGSPTRCSSRRLAAAEALLKLGEKSPLPVLVEALGVERRFFDLDFGVIARRRAWDALKPLVGEGVAYDPAAGRAKNADAIREIARRARSVAAARAIRRSAGDVEDAVFGIEVRSCRAGDQWIRLTSGGELVLGHYDLEQKKLDPKARRRAARARARGAVRVPRAGSRPAPFSAGPGVISKSGTCRRSQRSRGSPWGRKGAPPCSRRSSRRWSRHRGRARARRPRRSSRTGRRPSQSPMKERIETVRAPVPIKRR